MTTDTTTDPRGMGADRRNAGIVLAAATVAMGREPARRRAGIGEPAARRAGAAVDVPAP
jgi:hypothetical protein